MLNRKCYLCQSAEAEIVQLGTRDRVEVKVLECKNCGLVYLDSFDHIGAEFYEESGMYEFSIPDINALRNSETSDTKRRSDFISKLVRGKKILDFGSGAGFVLESLMGIASHRSAVELNRAFHEHLKSSGVQVISNLQELKPSEKFDIISSFHVVEHLPDPIAILSELRSHLNPGGKIIIEVPNGDDALLKRFKSDAFSKFTYWSCHLYTFKKKTLTETLRLAGFKNIDVRQVQRYPLANHLHWLSKNKPGGHLIWEDLNSVELNSLYEASLAKLDMCDTLIAIGE